jgi:hypothetical protein
LADHVEPGDLAKYIADLETARNSVGYTLRSMGPTRPSRALPWLAYIATGLLGTCLLMVIWTAVWFGYARAADPSKRFGTGRVLIVGFLLIWGPALIVLLSVTAKTGMRGGLPDGWEIVLVILVTYIASALSIGIWRDRWLAWAETQALDPNRVFQLAPRLRLPKAAFADEKPGV